MKLSKLTPDHFSDPLHRFVTKHVNGVWLGVFIILLGFIYAIAIQNQTNERLLKVQSKTDATAIVAKEQAEISKQTAIIVAKNQKLGLTRALQQCEAINLMLQTNATIAKNSAKKDLAVQHQFERYGEIGMARLVAGRIKAELSSANKYKALQEKNCIFPYTNPTTGKDVKLLPPSGKH